MITRRLAEGLGRMTPLDRVTAALLLVLLVAMPLLSQDYSITCDEGDHYEYGQLVLDFYTSGFQDRSSFTDYWNFLNGGIFDLAATLLQKVFPEANPYTVRHACNALAGWLGILFTTLLARRCFGPGAGLLALVFMVLFPRYLGHAMNNPKDVPFAAGYAFVLYAFSFVRSRYPFVTWKSAALLAVAVGALLNVRAGGLVVLGYAGLLLAALAVRDGSIRNGRRLLRLGGGFAAFIAVALLLGSLFWPWALVNPFLKPFEALATISDYPWTGTVHLAGQTYAGDELPWFYVPLWYLVATPLSLLAGFAGSFALLLRRQDRWAVAALLFTVLFPVVYVIIKQAVLYNGLRHMLFILPPMAVLAAGAWSRGLELLRGRGVRMLLALGLVLGLAHPLYWSVKLHPHQTIYFNELAGGPPEALKHYDMDYWGVCYKEALERIKGRWPHERPVKVFSPLEMCGNVARETAAFDPMLEHVESPEAADCIVSANLMLFEDVVQNLLLKPGFEAVERAGRPLCIINCK